MAWIKTVPEVEAHGELAAAYATVRQDHGSISNITEAASIHPRAMLALANLLHALRARTAHSGSAGRR